MHFQQQNFIAQLFQEQIAEMNVRFDAQSAMLKSLQKKLVKQADKQTEHMAELLELVRKR
jgi:hypothetical protein